LRPPASGIAPAHVAPAVPRTILFLGAQVAEHHDQRGRLRDTNCELSSDMMARSAAAQWVS